MTEDGTSHKEVGIVDKYWPNVKNRFQLRKRQKQDDLVIDRYCKQFKVANKQQLIVFVNEMI